MVCPDYIFTGDNDADLMLNSSSINLNVTKVPIQKKVRKLFYASSAFVYPYNKQSAPENPIIKKKTAYSANPGSECGWEKLFSERMYLNYLRNYDLNVKIARFHIVYDPLSNYNNGKVRAPAAICRKVIFYKEK